MDAKQLVLCAEMNAEFHMDYGSPKIPPPPISIT